MNDVKRCHWCPEKDSLYCAYHDQEWGVLRMEDAYLFEMLVLESFQAGLSWACILHKREAFRSAFDGFDPVKIASYSEEKIEALMHDTGIVRNRRKILATIKNAQVFLSILEEWGTFQTYLESFTKGKIFYEQGRTHSKLSDDLSKDLKRRGVRFFGTTIAYSYLQAVGIIDSHEKDCFLYKGEVQ